jgi:hypothetical protein
MIAIYFFLKKPVSFKPFLQLTRESIAMNWIILMLAILPVIGIGQKVNIHLIFKKQAAGNITSLEAERGGQLLHFTKQ